MFTRRLSRFNLNARPFPEGGSPRRAVCGLSALLLFGVLGWGSRSVSWRNQEPVAPSRAVEISPRATAPAPTPASETRQALHRGREKTKGARPAFRVAETERSARRRRNTPPYAYLERRARSARSLRQQLRRDPRLVERYARTFQITPERLQIAFRHLRLISLPEDRILQVHYVLPGEKLGYKLRRLKRGTLVFALPDGTPVLAHACGNPLRIDLSLYPFPWREYVIPPQGTPAVPDFDPNETLPSRAKSPAPITLAMRTALPEPLPQMALPEPDGVPPAVEEDSPPLPWLPPVARTSEPTMELPMPPPFDFSRRPPPRRSPTVPVEPVPTEPEEVEPPEDFVPLPDAPPPGQVPTTTPEEDESDFEYPPEQEIDDWIKNPTIDLGGGGTLPPPPKEPTPPRPNIIPEAGPMLMGLGLLAAVWAFFGKAKGRRQPTE